MLDLPSFLNINNGGATGIVAGPVTPPTVIVTVVNPVSISVSVKPVGAPLVTSTKFSPIVVIGPISVTGPFV